MIKSTFVNTKGEFEVKNPHKVNYTYFPLCNLKGMKSAITPTLNGDIKIDNNHFAMMPVSQEDLHNSKSTRNFWVNLENYGPWSAMGNSAKQIVDDKDEVTLEAGFLWHKIIRKNDDANVQSTVTTYVPSEDDFVEITKVTIENIGNEEISFESTVAVPLYSRSADNLRDHRHVTALLNRVVVTENGIINKPTLSFDERGHLKNEVSYAVLSKDNQGNSPCEFYPILEEFIGEGGALDWPKTITEEIKTIYKSGDKVEGYETIGAMKFERVTLKPNESKSFVFMIAIDENGGNFEDVSSKYCSIESFDKYLKENEEYWEEQLSTLQFGAKDAHFNSWMKWVTLQPILRRIYGCSFLPHHDYGRGGRGWRDLWQDCLALILMNPEDVNYLLYNNFGGVRVDGSNATIIGNKAGEFLADRNNIPRVWMDHGAWPFLTTKLYVDRSGDIDFLFRKQTYFKDSHISYSREIDEKWNNDYGFKQLDSQNKLYEGTIIEHLLIQNMIPFFNVGEHNLLRLEGADWNDGLDMADERGESVAFTSFYASNLLEIANMLEEIKNIKSIESIEVFKEMTLLFDTLNSNIDYNAITEKTNLLNEYFSNCNHNISGEKVSLKIDEIVSDLRKKGMWMIDNIRKNEWLDLNEDLGWFNGYYNNDGERLENASEENLRMTLTGQVFSIFSGTATDEQVEKIVDAANKYLRNDKVGGYRLNNDFKEVYMNMGRLFGFAFGHKENGAMFSHMAVMYGNALYSRGFAKEGFEVLNSIYSHCKDFETSKIYPGIPEYIDAKGRGMYHYLTGSASWMILNMVNEVFGVKGHFGDLVLEPKLLLNQFNEEGIATINTVFADKVWNISYINNANKEYGEYKITNLKVDGKDIDSVIDENKATITRQILLNTDAKTNKIEVILN